MIETLRLGQKKISNIMKHLHRIKQFLVNRFNIQILFIDYYGRKIKIIFLYFKTSGFGYDTEFLLATK